MAVFPIVVFKKGTQRRMKIMVASIIIRLIVENIVKNVAPS
jgi:hypothetical protein